MELSEEEKKAIEYIKEFKNEVFEGVGNKSIMAKNIDILLNLIKKQQKLIDIFIHNEAVREGKDFNEIKEKYYECL